tara:strand:- start:516 stop:773 length:258 start_codon:yes stop_codon:yes gene_type:complete
MDKNFDFTTMELLLQKIEKEPDNMELKAVINDLIMGSRKAGHLGLDMKEVASVCTLGWVVSQQPELESLLQYLLSRVTSNDELLN